MKQDRRKVLNPGKSFLKNDELPYLISEVGVNHDGSMERARMMIEEISQAGGDAVKFQAYKAETLASKIHRLTGIPVRKRQSHSTSYLKNTITSMRMILRS